MKQQDQNAAGENEDETVFVAIVLWNAFSSGESR